MEGLVGEDGYNCGLGDDLYWIFNEGVLSVELFVIEESWVDDEHDIVFVVEFEPKWELDVSEGVF